MKKICPKKYKGCGKKCGKELWLKIVLKQNGTKSWETTVEKNVEKMWNPHKNKINIPKEIYVCVQNIYLKYVSKHDNNIKKCAI